MMKRELFFNFTILSKVAKSITIFGLFILSTSVTIANAVDKYVTDDVNIYLHRGPGAQYAFSGAVKPGEKVEVLETNKDGKFTRIQSENGQTAWIDTAHLTDHPSLKAQLLTLQSEIAEYKKREESSNSVKLTETIDNYTAKLKAADKTIADLQNQLKKQNEQLDSMTTQVDEKRQKLIQTWFIYGGSVAGVGLLVGLILPLIMPRRQRKDRWMN